MRNKQTLHTLLQQNPESFEGVRFTCEATITSVTENRAWNYSPCSQCTKKSDKQNGSYICEDHEKQDPLTYRYNFKATISDGTATAYFTFFTIEGEKITDRPCSELVYKYKETNQRQLPIEIVNIIGKKQIFQFHFTPSARQASGQFTVVDILDIQRPLQIHIADDTLATSTYEATKESTSKDNITIGAQPREVIEDVSQTILSIMTLYNMLILVVSFRKK